MQKLSSIRNLCPSVTSRPHRCPGKITSLLQATSYLSNETLDGLIQSSLSTRVEWSINVWVLNQSGRRTQNSRDRNQSGVCMELMPKWLPTQSPWITVNSLQHQIPRPCVRKALWTGCSKFFGFLLGGCNSKPPPNPTSQTRHWWLQIPIVTSL